MSIRPIVQDQKSNIPNGQLGVLALSHAVVAVLLPDHEYVSMDHLVIFLVKIASVPLLKRKKMSVVCNPVRKSINVLISVTIVRDSRTASKILSLERPKQLRLKESFNAIEIKKFPLELPMCSEIVSLKSFGNKY